MTLSPIFLLTCLLAVAYLGTLLVSGRAIRGSGLPSGTEFLFLGVLLGPKFLGLVSLENREWFEPFNAVALSWLGVVSGLHYGRASGAFGLPSRTMGTGLLVATFSAGLTAGAAALVGSLALGFQGSSLLLFALGIGAVSAETTRHAVRWVVQRHAASGPLTDLVGSMSEGDDAVALLLLALATSLAQPATALVPGSWAPLLGVAVSLGLGVVLGITLAALFKLEGRSGQRWGILLGATLLGVGVSLKLGLSAVWVAFVMGIAASLASNRANEPSDMVEPTERPTMLPALIIAGAYVSLPTSTMGWIAAGAAVLARVLSKLASGRAIDRWLRASSTPQPAVSPFLYGASLLPAGVLSITAGLSVAIGAPGPAAEIVLFVAVANTLLGELFGTPALRWALRQRGEIGDMPRSSSAVRTSA